MNEVGQNSSTVNEIENLVSATFQAPETFTEINGLP